MRAHPISALTLRQLRHFICVAQSPTLSSAATQLSISQPALTESVRHIERLLDCTLFDRSSKRLRLTAVGKSILPIAERLLKVSSDAFGDIYSLIESSSQTLHIGMIPSAAHRVLGALATIERETPDIRFDISDQPNTVLMKQLEYGQLDLVIGVQDKYVGDALRCEQLFDDELMVVMHKHDVLAEYPGIELKQLRHRKLATFKRGNVSNMLSYVNSEFETALEPTYRMEYTEPLYELARRQLALTILPKLYTDSLSDPVLIAHPIVSPGFNRTIALFSLNSPSHASIVSECHKRLLELLRADTA